ncbi:MAG: TIGR00266 family protein [Polyangiaceae bacterium]|nr:TIGR00266 family protein [Polyangiaceae bacterium]
MPPNLVPAGSQLPALRHEITHGPSFAMLRVDLESGQSVVAEAGVMVARNQSVGMEAKLNAPRSGGFFAILKALFVAVIRKYVGGETFIVNHFTANQQRGSVWLAPAMSGHVAYRRMNGEKLTLSTGAYLAHAGEVDLGLKFGGLQSLLAKEGAFFLEVSGFGDLWFTSYGGIEAVDVNGDFVVDNGHLVGYEGNLGLTIGTAGGGLMGMVASGEGLVCKFNGQGRVYLQSRNQGSLVGWLTPMMG